MVTAALYITNLYSSRYIKIGKQHVIDQVMYKERYSRPCLLDKCGLDTYPPPKKKHTHNTRKVKKKGDDRLGTMPSQMRKTETRPR